MLLKTIKTFTTLTSLLSLLFLFSINTTNASSCSQLDKNAAIPDGYGASFNAQSNEKELSIKTTCSDAQVEVEVGNGSDIQYVYSKGYIYENNKWQLIDFTGDNKVDSWFKGSARTMFNSSSVNLDGPKYIVAYICTWINSTWKCGCRDKACNNNYWQLQIFNKGNIVNQQCKDNDGDGFGDPNNYCANTQRDCDDTNKNINPGKVELCGNNIDENCDGEILETCDTQIQQCKDEDSDKFDNCSPAEEGDDRKQLDCDDTREYVNPDAKEACDGLDNNCNETIDEGCDDDEDGYCDISLPFYLNDKESISSCPFSKENGTNLGDDCNDKDGKKSPGAIEECDGIDNNCNKKVDEGACDTEMPVVSFFDVAPIETDKTITISWSVSDNVAIKQTEIWRTDDINGNPNISNWTLIYTQEANLDNIITGTYIDSPVIGIWWYGLHVVDTANNMSTESNGPIKITIIKPSTCVDIDQDGYDNCSTGEYGDDGKQIDCDDSSISINPGQVEQCDEIDNNCNGENNENDSCVDVDEVIKILPLGDSITNGADMGDIFSRFDSYRRHLWLMLKNNSEKSYDFVGSQKKHLLETQELIHEDYDNDHEGYSGLDVSELLDSNNYFYKNVFNTIKNDKPNIVLIHLGTNDINNNSSIETIDGDLRTLINEIFSEKNDIKIILAKIIPSKLTEYNQKISLLNDKIEIIANSDSRIYLIDLNNGFNVNWLIDDWHPGDEGDYFIAQKFFNIISNIDNDKDCVDIDQDGYDDCSTGENGDDGKQIDCNDNDYWVNPGLGYETCDTTDNNCDGQIDEGCDDDGDGYCNEVKTIYRNNSMCPKTLFEEGGYGDDCNDNNTSLNPGTTEICDGIDNNCDNVIDENCDCINNQTQTCGTDIGECQAGIQTCQNGKWIECQGDIKAQTEICDGKDNDCNNQTDENLVTPYNDNQQGVCQNSMKQCSGLDGWQNDYTSIPSNEFPDETSCDGLDNNCDGQVDETCACQNGETRSCGNSNIGICEYGIETCEYGNWVECQGEITAQTEICGNGVDEDCNGLDLECNVLSVSIEAPEDASNFFQNVYGISFNSKVFGGKYPYVYKWTSDKYGDFGEQQYAYLFGGGDNQREDFILGEHKITLTVTDANGTEMSQMIKIYVNPISAFKVEIRAGEGVGFGNIDFVDYMQLSANVSGGVAPFSYSWSTPEKGIFSEDQYASVNFKSTPWSLGEHVVTVNVTDGNSLLATDSTVVNVVAMDVAIYSSDYVYFKSETTFYANVMGGTAPFDIKISSNLDGELYHGENSVKNYVNYKVSTLSEGLHQIILEVVDSQGNTVTSNTQIQVNPIDVSKVACFDFSDCNDSLPCTEDVCTNPGSMTATCSNVAKTICQNNDSCCPGECNSSSDNDCSVSADNDDPKKVLVVYNNKCASDNNKNGVRDYVELAEYYKQKRNIPDENMLAVYPSVGSSGCASYYYKSEKYPDFYNDIVLTIQNKLSELGENNIYYINLIGVPTTIYTDQGTRSLDHALATLNSIEDSSKYLTYWDYCNSSEYCEVYYGSTLSKPRFNHSFKHDGNNMYLVTRVHDLNLIDRALYGEKYIYNEVGYYRGMGYVDTRYKEYTDSYLNDNYPSFSDSTSYARGDRKMAYGKRIFEIEGWDYRWESTGKEIGESDAIFGDGSSAEFISDAMWYEGWYNFGRYLDVWQWKAGAVACDLNSDSGVKFLQGAFKKGLTAGVGVTGEPYLTGHPQPEVFIHYMLNGYNFAESSILSYPGWKWRDIAYGDPLYNPNKVGKIKTKDTVKPDIMQIVHKSNVSDTASSCSILARLNLNSINPDVATFKLEYGTDVGYGLIIDYDEVYSVEKIINLQNLLSNTNYHYRVSAKDPVGNISVSGDNVCKTSPDKSVLPDSVNASALTQEGNAPLTVNFSSTLGSVPSSIKWNFADGDTSMVSNPSHSFSKGFYKVILHAEFSNGLSTYKELLIISK